jgi:hypothetical protein
MVTITFRKTHYPSINTNLLTKHGDLLLHQLLQVMAGHSGINCPREADVPAPCKDWLYRSARSTYRSDAR